MKSHLKRIGLLGLSAGLLGFAATSLTAVADHHGDKDADKDAPKTAEVGKPAPDFELTDIDGKTHKLSDYKGKTVILEWWNPECPFVVYLYREGNFKSWPNELHAKDDYVWLAINSGSPGLQGAGLEKSKHYRDEYKMEVPVLLDKDGTVGRLYQARVTPHMYIIDPEGVIRYIGASDNAPMGRPRGGDDEVINYVARALDQMRAGETVTPDTTRAYGCTVKYAPGQGLQDRGARGRERGERGARGSERGRRDGERGRRGGSGTRDR
jgi:peroxiredoxin